MKIFNINTIYLTPKNRTSNNSICKKQTQAQFQNKQELSFGNDEFKTNNVKYYLLSQKKYKQPDYFTKIDPGDLKKEWSIFPEILKSAILTQNNEKNTVFHSITSEKLNVIQEILGDDTPEVYKKALFTRNVYGDTPLTFIKADELKAFAQGLGDDAKKY